MPLEGEVRESLLLCGAMCYGGELAREAKERERDQGQANTVRSGLVFELNPSQ